MASLANNPPIPSSRRAIAQDAHGKPQLVHRIPVPTLLPGTILVQPAVVALNPSDYKMCAAFPTPGAVVGNDFAGTVVAVGNGVTALAPGDVVCGGIHSSDPDAPENGAFAEYVRVPADFMLRATNLDMDQAATLGTALATCTLALWGTDALNLPATPENPASTPLPVLVYGGSTATGTMAIQLLHLAGLAPIATCSPRNFDLVRSFGATAVFDFTRPDTAAEIKAHTGGRLKHVLDCISDTQSVECCYASIARVGGRYTSLELVPDELLAKRRAVRGSFVLAFQISGEQTKLPGGYGKPADPGKRELSRRCFAMYQKLLDEGKLRTHPTQLLGGGLEGILAGLALLKSGSVSGRKLIARLT